MNASIIIPTHNRIHTLLQTIKSASRLTFPKKDFEIIVVENACTDGTKLKVKELLHKSTVQNLKIISENSMGVHFARNSGAKVAKGEILIFVDDDVLLSSNLLSAYMTSFQRYPEMAAAGGLVLPKWETPPPEWLTNFIGKSKTFFILGLMKPYNKFHLSTKGFFFSNNMAIRREILFRMGGFNPELVGDEYIGNGEAGLNQKLWEKGLLVGYVPAALIYHKISSQRMTINYFIHRMKNEGASGMYGKYHKNIPSKPHLTFDMFEIIIRNLRVLFREPFMRQKTDRYSLLVQMEKAKAISEVLYIKKLMVNSSFRKLVLRKRWL